MKKMAGFTLLCMITAMIGFSACKGGEKAQESKEKELITEEKGEVLKPESFEVTLPNSEDTLTVKARIPADWVRNPDLGAVVFQPADYADYFYPPVIHYEISCSGSCDPKAIRGNIEKNIQGIKDILARPNINTGDPELDAIRATVEIITEEKFREDGWIFAAAVTYPEHLSKALYIPKFVVHTFRHHPGDGFFIHTIAMAPLDKKEELLPVLREACKETNY